MAGAFGSAGFVAVEAGKGALEVVEVARGFLAGGEIKDARLAAKDVAVSDGGFDVLVEADAGFVVVKGLASCLEAIGFTTGAAFVVGAVVVLLAPNVPELRIWSEERRRQLKSELKAKHVEWVRTDSAGTRSEGDGDGG